MISFAEMIQEIIYAESMLTWKIQMISAVIMNKYPTQCYLPKTVKVLLQHETARKSDRKLELFGTPQSATT